MSRRFGREGPLAPHNQSSVHDIDLPETGHSFSIAECSGFPFHTILKTAGTANSQQPFKAGALEESHLHGSASAN